MKEKQWGWREWGVALVIVAGVLTLCILEAMRP